MEISMNMVFFNMKEKGTTRRRWYTFQVNLVLMDMGSKIRSINSLRARLGACLTANMSHVDLNWTTKDTDELMRLEKTLNLTVQRRLQMFGRRCKKHGVPVSVFAEKSLNLFKIYPHI
jgi:hypothetical protein